MFRGTALTRTVILLLSAAAAAVCQIRIGIPDNSAKVVVQYGRLSALGSTGELALSTGDLVKAQQMILTGPDGYGKFQIDDGSTFEVFANSRVMFREHPNNSLKDLLNVVLGRVKVMIEHLNGVPNYKEVSSPTAVISVRGTIFDVTVEDDDGTTLVSVDEGEVWVRSTTAPGDWVSLQTNSSIRVYRNQPIAIRTLDKGALALRIIRALQQAMYQVVLKPRVPVGGVGSAAGTGISTTVSGDTGKTGSSPGSTTSPTAPGAPAAPGAPGPPR